MEFDKRGIRVVAISADTSETSKRQSAKMGYTFLMLADPKAEVIRKYGLLHPGGGPHKEDISRPAEFLVNSTGKVEWRNVTDSIGVRTRPEDVFRAYDDHGTHRD